MMQPFAQPLQTSCLRQDRGPRVRRTVPGEDSSRQSDNGILGAEN